MGVHIYLGTMAGALTPICNGCMIALCWDIGEDEYENDRGFWDNWLCQDCNGGIPMKRERGDSRSDK